MSIGLFYTTRNVTGTFSAGLLCNLRILETQADQIDWLTINKTDKGAEHIRKFTGLKIGQRLEYLTKPSGDTWKKIYDNIDPTPLSIYDKLFLMGGIHFPQSKLSRGTDRALKFPIDDKGQLKFQQVAKHVLNVMLIHKAHVEFQKPLYEFCYETDELETYGWQVPQYHKEHYKYHVYDIPEYGMKRLDSLQYYFQNKKKGIFPPSKDINLTFGYTLYSNGNRPSYVDWINKMAKKFNDSKIYVKDAINKKDNIIPFEQYLEMVERSRFTLIIPSYDANTFSMYRFIEAIQRNCLPLIHPDCKIDDVEESFGMDLNPLMQKSFPSEFDRKVMLEYYKSKILTFERNFHG